MFTAFLNLVARYSVAVDYFANAVLRERAANT